MTLPRFVRAPAARALSRPKTMRRDQFATLPLPPGRILFLGDSITEQGMWHEWFPQLPTLNRGIGGETVREVQARLDTAVREPALISLLVGTNDLTGLGRSVRPADIAQDMDGLVLDLVQRAAGVPMILNSVMPRAVGYAPRVRELNDRFREIAARHGATYLDLWPALADETDRLRSVYTADSLHLNGHGYRAWVDVLEPVLTGLLRGTGATT